MSDYRLKVTIRNARLLRAIEAAGYKNQAEFARAVPMSVISLNALVAMREAPINKLGNFSPSAKVVMEALGASPADLWTDEQLYANLKRNTAEIDISTPEALSLSDSSGGIARIEDSDSVTKITRYFMGHMSDREKTVVGHRLAGDTLDEVGAKMDVSRERIRQIEAGAYRKMRSLAGKLPAAERETLADYGANPERLQRAASPAGPWWLE